MAETLYIIGNGFDLHHKLNTSYSSFRDYARKKQKLTNWLSSIYGKAIYKSEWWWQFEENLAKVDYTNLMRSLNGNGNALGFMQIKNLFNNLPFFFNEWLNSLELDVQPDCNLNLDSNAMFFTFNYTLLLEKIYNINPHNIWHIHNSLIDKDKKLIVGHDSNNGELFKLFLTEKEKNGINISGFTDDVRRELLAGAKNVSARIFNNKELFYRYSYVKHYIAMGFSFNRIDMPYIEKIVSVNHLIENSQWTLYCHSNKEAISIKEQLERININGNNIKIIKW